MTNNRKGKVFTLPFILYLISQAIMVISILAAVFFLVTYRDTRDISYIVASLILILIADFGLNCEKSTFTKTSKRKIYEMVLRTVVSYIFFCLTLLAIIQKSIFLGILVVIAFIVMAFVEINQGFDQ